jgi:hypothetical protein
VVLTLSRDLPCVTSHEILLEQSAERNGDLNIVGGA